MNKQFHTLAPLIALKQMPKQFQDFLICESYTVKQLQIDSDLPDLVDHDAILQNSEIHHAHSYKLELQKDNTLLHIDGDVYERLEGLASDCHDFHAENKPDLVRYCLSKNTHYRVDSLTMPHLFRGKPWSLHHEKFEIDMGKFIVKHQAELEKMVFEFKPYKNIVDDSIKLSEIMWHKGLDAVNVLEKGGKISDEVKLDICKTCILEIGNLWLTLCREMKICLE